MKTIEIDIDDTDSPLALAREFEIRDLRRGDSLRIISSKINDNSLLEFAIVVMILIALSKLYNDREDFTENLLNNLFIRNHTQDIEKDIKKIYNIDLLIEIKEDAEQGIWRQFSKSKLAKAYSETEPEYDLNMVKEPNPRYNTQKNENR